MVKNRGSGKKTFAQVCAELKPKTVQVPVIIEGCPKIDDVLERKVDEDVDNEPFRWCFMLEDMRLSGSFSFKKYKKDLKSFLEEIERPIYEIFHGLKWWQVNQRDHCGKYAKNLNEKQMTIVRSTHKPDDEHLYHIHISQRHVLFGYRIDNVLHITINDPEHEFDKL